MFFSHAPAGYLVVKFARKFKTDRADVFTAMLAGILPDFDMIYFHLIDERAHIHHSYWTHMPHFWVVVYAAALIVAAWLKSKRIVYYATLIFSCVIVHLILDSVAASGILWAYPFSIEYYELFVIPQVHDSRMLNYVLHWTFLIEMLIILVAIVVALRCREFSRLWKAQGCEAQ